MITDEMKKELVDKYNELTAKINELNQERVKVVGKLEFVEEIEKPKEEEKWDTLKHMKSLEPL